MIGSLAVLALTLAGSVAEPEPAVVTAAQARIGPVGLRADEAAVRRAYGAPLDARSLYDHAADAPARELVYPELTVYIVAGEVCSIVCRTPSFATPAGVRVGDLEASVAAAYGATSPLEIGGNRLLRYNIEGSDCWLDFRIQRGKVAEIRIWFDYA